jgi:hypothetical protein
MSETKRLVRQDAVDVIVESGLSKNRHILAMKASTRQGPSYTYGPNGAEYDEGSFVPGSRLRKPRRGDDKLKLAHPRIIVRR